MLEAERVLIVAALKVTDKALLSIDQTVPFV